MAQKQPGKPGAELQRRRLARQAAGKQRHAEPDGEPQTTAGWWRQFEADLAAVDRAIEREHQAALAAGQPWPPEHKPQPEPGSEPEPAAGSPRAAEPANWSERPVSSPEAASDYEPDGRSARLDELLARVSQAAQRVAAETAGRQARAEYAARIEREAQAGPELTLQAEAPDEAEVEL